MEKNDNLLKYLYNINELINEDSIKNASNEQLLEYLKLTNRLKAVIKAALESKEEEK